MMSGEGSAAAKQEAGEVTRRNQDRRNGKQVDEDLKKGFCGLSNNANTGVLLDVGERWCDTVYHNRTALLLYSCVRLLW